jgi:hypothetical protein
MLPLDIGRYYEDLLGFNIILMMLWSIQRLLVEATFTCLMSISFSNPLVFFKELVLRIGFWLDFYNLDCESE